MARLLVVDNYDSFTWNLVTVLARAGHDCGVVRNDDLEMADLAAAHLAGIILSPGPGRPAQAGRTMEVVDHCLDTGLPLLGICLGMQALAEALGAKLMGARHILHGQSSPITHDQVGLFEGLTTPLTVGRYHSLAVDEATLPPELRVTARSDDGEIMALHHTIRPAWGVQFHPESVLTSEGESLMGNFAQLCMSENRDAPILP